MLARIGNDRRLLFLLGGLRFPIGGRRAFLGRRLLLFATAQNALYRASEGTAEAPGLASRLATGRTTELFTLPT